MKDYDELLKYYELYETIGTGNSLYYFLEAEARSPILEYTLFDSWEIFNLTCVVLKFSPYLSKKM
jgi:hypothetical protein